MIHFGVRNSGFSVRYYNFFTFFLLSFFEKAVPVLLLKAAPLYAYTAQGIRRGPVFAAIGFREFCLILIKRTTN
jgi:hypothetical protein